jgi:quinol monooxygenase YgiN
MKLREMDDQVTYVQQLQEDDGQVILINQFNLGPEDAERFLQVWADDAAFMKRQPGFVSTQLHRGTAGSTTFINTAVWESARALGRAFSSPDATPTAPSPPRTSLRRSPCRASAPPSTILRALVRIGPAAANRRVLQELEIWNQ